MPPFSVCPERWRVPALIESLKGRESYDRRAVFVQTGVGPPPSRPYTTSASWLPKEAQETSQVADPSKAAAAALKRIDPEMAQRLKIR